MIFIHLGRLTFWKFYFFYTAVIIDISVKTCSWVVSYVLLRLKQLVFLLNIRTYILWYDIRIQLCWFFGKNGEIILGKIENIYTNKLICFQTDITSKNIKQLLEKCLKIFLLSEILVPCFVERYAHQLNFSISYKFTIFRSTCRLHHQTSK